MTLRVAPKWGIPFVRKSDFLGATSPEKRNASWLAQGDFLSRFTAKGGNQPIYPVYAKKERRPPAPPVAIA